MTLSSDYQRAKVVKSTQEELRDSVLGIVNTIETGNYRTSLGESGSASEYLEDVLDIRFVISSRKEFLGAQVLVAFGGPTIWIHTLKNTVEGTWWNESFTERYFTDALGLNEVLEEYYECL